MLAFLRLDRARAVWADPLRTHKTLASFAETEHDGGQDLVRAARRATSPELRAHLERHAQDEVRHAELFRRRAAEVAREVNLPVQAQDEADKPYDLSRGRPGLELDAHGFFSAGLIDELGELEYVAMLHVAEQRAAELFEKHHALTAGDPATQQVFAEILRDEKYHVAYTGTFLERWRREGREREVAAALGAARGSRMFGAWKRLGLRSGMGFAHVVLYALYWTALAPFGLVARRRALPGGLAEAALPRDPSGQY